MSTLDNTALPGQDASGERERERDTLACTELLDLLKNDLVRRLRSPPSKEKNGNNKNPPFSGSDMTEEVVLVQLFFGGGQGMNSNFLSKQNFYAVFRTPKVPSSLLALLWRVRLLLYRDVLSGIAEQRISRREHARVRCSNCLSDFVKILE